MTMTKFKIPRTTVGRFWGYVGILIALSVSLAGNVAAAYLQTPEVAPTWVELGFAGLAPLSAFISIEIVNHNPWKGEKWGQSVKWILLAIVAPAAAVVSFIHLTTVVMHERQADLSPTGVLNWVTAVLTALLIDGLMFGGTAALLLPKRAVEPEDEVMPETDLRAMTRVIQEGASALAMQSQTPEQFLKPTRRPKTVQPSPEGRRRWPPREHPLWDAWAQAHASGEPWSATDMQMHLKNKMDREVSVGAAGMMITRWEKELVTN